MFQKSTSFGAAAFHASLLYYLPFVIECNNTSRIMKIGNPFAGTEVPLPSEVLDLILLHLDQQPSRRERQHDLWSSCLISRSWYSVALKRLYRWPRLTPRNFDRFARTLCPPVGSRVSKVGLEHFVVYLDMDRLAYESTKSLTARLLRRTRLSLERFIAPNISFS